jgi:hypothetical protein
VFSFWFTAKYFSFLFIFDSLVNYLFMFHLIYCNYFVVAVIELRASQLLYHLSHAPSPFVFVFCFSGRVSLTFCLGWPQILESPASASWVSGITVVYYHTQFSIDSLWACLIFTCLWISQVAFCYWFVSLFHFGQRMYFVWFQFYFIFMIVGIKHRASGMQGSTTELLPQLFSNLLTWFMA